MSHYTASDDVIEGLVTSASGMAPEARADVMRVVDLLQKGVSSREQRLTALGIAPAAWWCWTDSDIAKAERKARRARRC